MVGRIILFGIICFLAFVVLNTLPFISGFFQSFPSGSSGVVTPKLNQPGPTVTVSPSVSVPLPRKKHPEFFQYYGVKGQTYQQVRDQLRQLGPKDGEGIIRDAVTNWDLNPAFKYQQDGGSCSLAWFDPKLTITVILPRWDNLTESGSATHQARWNQFLDVLENHESMHVEIALDEVDLMQAEIKQIVPDKECLMVGNQAMIIFDKHKQTLLDRQNDLDQKTRASWTQSANLKTLTNDRYGYSIKVPPGLAVNTSDPDRWTVEGGLGLTIYHFAAPVQIECNADSEEVTSQCTGMEKITPFKNASGLSGFRYLVNQELTYHIKNTVDHKLLGPFYAFDVASVTGYGKQALLIGPHFNAGPDKIDNQSLTDLVNSLSFKK